MKKRTILLTLLFILLPVLAGASAENTPERKLTLMVYMCGSNLESTSGAATADIREMMEAVPPGGDVAVLVMTGGTQASGTSQFFPDNTVNIYEIASGRSRCVWQSGMQMSMGSGDTLVQLLDFGGRQYPAQDYALIIWNHGGGPLAGICWDDLFSMDNLSLSEISLAVSRKPGDQKLSWIGFDACLMCTAEVAAAVAPYAHYMIASQETEPSGGWDYSFLSEIAEDADGAATGKRIIDHYFRSLEGTNDTLTLSCIDLEKTDRLLLELDRFFQPVADRMDPELFSKVSGLRMATVSFGKGQRDIGLEGYDLVDIADLAGHFDAPDDALAAAVGDAVVYSRSNKEGVHGLSVYHPYKNKDQYSSRWKTDYQNLHFCKGYSSYVERFGACLLEESSVDWSGLETQYSGPDQDKTHHFSLQLTPEQQAECLSAQLVILQYNEGIFSYEDNFFQVFTGKAVPGENGTLTAEYKNQALYVLDENGTVLSGPVSFLQDEDEEDTAVVQATYLDNSGKQETRQIAHILYYCSLADSSGNCEITRRQVYDPVTGSYTNRLAFPEKEYTDLWFLSFPRILPDTGRAIPRFSLWEEWETYEYGAIDASSDWHFQLVDHWQQSNLYAMFQITDKHQNVWSSIPVPLVNPDEQPVSLLPDTIDTDFLSLTVSATINHAAEEPGVNLRFAMTNCTDWLLSVTLGKILLNNDLQLPDETYIDMSPGETNTFSIFLDKNALMGLKTLTEFSAEMMIEYSETASEDYWLPEGSVPVPFRLTIKNCDVSGIAAERPSVLAEAEKNGLLWQLLSLSEEPDGSISGLIFLRNNSPEPERIDYSLYMNDVLVMNFLDINSHTPVQPGSGWYIPFTAENRIVLDSAYMQVRSRDNFDIAVLDDVLGLLDIHSVERISIRASRFFGYWLSFVDGKIPDCSLELSEPLQLSGTGAGSMDMKPLLEGDVSADVIAAFVGDEAAALALRCRNDRNDPASIFFENASVNGIPSVLDWYSYMEYSLAPHSQAVFFLTAKPEDIPRQGAEIRDLRLSFSMDTESSTEATVLFPDGTVFDTDGGTFLMADRLTVIAAQWQ